ncbi:MAG TPA: sigma-70 family RNA polymerase sigma factor [Acidimicrobiales bacterium]|nr:sigma-70 family RNA polymerase sigma factor [Acidimicrobiales bacterium]
MDEALAGDAQALDRLLRHHYDRLYALCRRMTGNDADAADVTQEALVAIARAMARGRFDGRSRFGTWAYRVTFNACIDELRRRQRRPVPVEALPEVPSPSGVLTDELVTGRVDVDAALRRLPPEFRAAVVLRDLCGLDYAEIAEVLDIPPGTVRSRIARGRAALATLLRNPAAAPERPTPWP